MRHEEESNSRFLENRPSSPFPPSLSHTLTSTSHPSSQSVTGIRHTFAILVLSLPLFHHSLSRVCVASTQRENRGLPILTHRHKPVCVWISGPCDQVSQRRSHTSSEKESPLVSSSSRSSHTHRLIPSTERRSQRHTRVHEANRVSPCCCRGVMSVHVSGDPLSASSFSCV